MRRRNMFYATGLPGWMRFGYSPGWVGRSADGLGPCARYLMTGQWGLPVGTQVPQAPGQVGQAGQAMPQVPFAGAQAAPQQRLAFLQAQMSMLEQQLQAVQAEIAEMENQG